MSDNSAIILNSDSNESNTKQETTENTNQNELSQSEKSDTEVKTETTEGANQEDFSSEKYKIEVKNLPSCFGYANLRKFFNGLNLKFVKIKAPQSSNFAFLTFVNEETKLEAIKLINSTKYKGKQLEAVVSAVYLKLFLFFNMII